MAHIRSDIPYGYDDTSRVGFWTPETPEFLDKRDARRAARYQSATSYSQAKAAIRRVSLANQETSARAWAEHSGQARIVDFEQLERAHAAQVRERNFDAWDGGRRDGYGAGEARPYRSEAVARDSRESRMDAPRSRRRGNIRAVASSRGGATSRRTDWQSATSGGWGRQNDFDEYDERDEYDEQPADTSLIGRLRKARHESRHRKADRAFSRDYAQDVPSEDGPRAAVYRGKMGRQHQRAARMQSSESQFSLHMPAFLVNAVHALSLDRIVFRPWFAVTAVSIFCVVVVAGGVYPAAQDYYLQMRANDRLAAEYEALVDRNAELESHVAALQTDEGMEELAHESLGWVREGENSVSVLTDGSADPGTSALAETQSVAEGSVPAPETWYSPVLDVVFGYED